MHVEAIDVYRNSATENEFASAVVEMARRLGWKCMFIPDWLYRLAIRDMRQRPRKGHDWPDKGFVDCVFCKERPDGSGRCLAVELKVGTNRPTAEQRWWMRMLAAVGMDVRVWTPQSWPEIEETLAA